MVGLGPAAPAPSGSSGGLALAAQGAWGEAVWGVGARGTGAGVGPRCPKGQLTVGSSEQGGKVVQVES